MKLKFIGCSIFRHEVEHLLQDCPNEVECQWLPQGLHAVPDTLRKDLQEAIDATDSAEGFTAILIGYGLCSRGVEGLVCRHAPLVIPRTHDCIAVFLGGHQRYLGEFRKHPGTYWFTRGFIEHGGQPGVKGKHRGIDRRYESVYEDYRARYGEELARYLVEEWDQKWMGNYSRAAYVHWDYADAEEHRAFTRDCACNLGWEFHELPGDLGLLDRMLRGEWHPDEFVVVMPGMQPVATHDGRILEAMSPADLAAIHAGSGQEESVTLLTDEDGTTIETDAAPPEAGAAVHDGLGLGLDAGGTYTDAALYDFVAEAVLATAKGRTTPHDPALGVDEAIASLPADRFGEVRLVSLATTFATNAIVEGRGCRVGLVLAGYDDWSLERIPHRPCRIVPGSHAADGSVIEPLDEDAAAAAIRELIDAEQVEALALVSTFACRNPDHEVALQRIAAENCDLPVVCGHELSNDLGAIERAVTASLNARISPVVVELVQSVEAALKARGIVAPLSIVRADGSLVRAEEACRRPVEMILSGPAASLCGAHALTGIEDAVVLDMGGTTSDVARIAGGRPLPGSRGAVVGPHRTVVRAPNIRTTGLGGDSHVRVHRGGEVTVGPRRVLPLCWTAARHPDLVQRLKRLATEDKAELLLLQPAEAVVALRDATSPVNRYSPLEQRLFGAVQDGPRTILDLAEELDYPYLTCMPTERLEEAGLIIRTGLTPTDLQHAAGGFDRWDADAARLGLELAASRLEISADELSRRAHEALREHMARTLLAAGLDIEEERLAGHQRGDALERILLAAITKTPDRVVRASLALSVPIIGIGAPAGAFVPAAATVLNTECHTPAHAEVAGAVGAITGSILQEEVVLVRPDAVGGGFLVHACDELRSFARYSDAKEHARGRALDLVRRKAMAAGAGRFHTRLSIQDRHAPSREQGVVYVETRVVAAAAGAPLVK